MSTENKNLSAPEAGVTPKMSREPAEYSGATLAGSPGIGSNAFLHMKQYQVIYADPPWRYDFSKSDSRKIENQYPTMSTEEICALAVPSAKDAVLYLWATAPKLLESLEVMRAWGFTYKSQAVWDKRKIGMGYWFRGQHEILLVGTRGKFSPPEQQKRVGSVFSYTRREAQQEAGRNSRSYLRMVSGQRKTGNVLPLSGCGVGCFWKPSGEHDCSA